MNTGVDPADSAVTRMTTKFLPVSEEETAGAIRRTMSEKAKELEVTDRVYVVDSDSHLQGVASLSDILQAGDDVQVKMVMKKKPVAVDVHSDQERVAYLVLKNRLSSIPVVDGENRLAGVVPYDTILDILHHEFREDILKSGGIHHHIKEIEDLATPAFRLVRARLPSLALGLVGGLFAAFIVSGFEGILSSYFVLAAFVPLMIYLSDAVGTQSQTLIVRMIALEPGFSVRRYLSREVRVAAILGAVFALMLFAAASLGWGPVRAGLAIGVAILVSMVFQALVSTYLSISLAKARVDPAVTSGPLTTIISDITTLALYFGIASLLIDYF